MKNYKRVNLITHLLFLLNLTILNYAIKINITKEYIPNNYNNLNEN
jgi:hypothetical protein